MEFDAFLCCHCQRLLAVEPPAPGAMGRQVWALPRFGLNLRKSEAQTYLVEPEYCQSCDAHHCGKPACRVCIPVEAKLEHEEGTRDSWRSAEITGW